jgi:hypothetical protein
MVMITNAVREMSAPANVSSSREISLQDLYPPVAAEERDSGLGRWGWVFLFAYLTGLAPMSANLVQARPDRPWMSASACPLSESLPHAVAH